jgi:outer membrane lipoprotein carrier protein
MLRLVSIVLIGFFASTNVFSQTKAQSEKSDPEAKKVLDKVRTKYESYKAISADFSLAIELPGQPKQVQKGTIAQEGDKFRLDMDDQIIASDGKTTYVYIKKNKEIQITDTDPKDMSENGFMTPRELLKRYEKGDFVYAISEKVTENKVLVTQIEFKPKDKKSDFSKLRLSVDEKTNTIKSIKAFTKDSGRFTFSLNSTNTAAKFGKDHFAIDAKKYPGVKVVDLRM